jgi:ribosomal protein S19E (S16A)
VGQVKCFVTKCQRPFSVQTAQKNIAKQALHSLEQLGVAELHL